MTAIPWDEAIARRVLHLCKRDLEHQTPQRIPRKGCTHMTISNAPGNGQTSNHSNGSGGRFYIHRLENGLQILAEHMPDFESVALAFHVRTGARDEADPRLYGVSHFLEHMVFKGTEQRSAEEISLAFNNIGAEFNAFTSLEQTFYYARVLGENLAPAIELLADMMRPKLDAGE